MNDPTDSPPPAREAPEPPKQPVSRQSITYGKPPIDENASGRRARLRHPRRGAQGR